MGDVIEELRLFGLWFFETRYIDVNTLAPSARDMMDCIVCMYSVCC